MTQQRSTSLRNALPRVASALACVLLLAVGGCQLAGFHETASTRAGQAPGTAGVSPAATAPGDLTPRLEAGTPQRLPPGTVPAGRGLVELRVHWPERAGVAAQTRLPGESRGPASVLVDSGIRRNDGTYRAQLIPDSTGRVLFEVGTASVVVASASVSRAAGATSSTASLELDAGAYDLAAAAFAGTEAGATRIATASAPLVVVAGAKVGAGLTLRPAYVPAVASQSATQSYPGGSVIFEGANLVLAWAATPSVLFTGPGASVSAVVTAMAEGSVTVTVPATALTGSVQVVTDGVASELVALAVAPTPAPTPIPTPTPVPTPVPTATPPAGYVAIASGSFTMGSPDGEAGRGSNETEHQVTLTHPFWLTETEVTQGQWKAAFGGSNPSGFTSCGDSCPVEQVTWWSALEYANALSASASLPACYTVTGCTGGTAGAGTLTGCTGITVTAAGGDPYLCTGYRLPTESEWEYAYRAGTTTAFYNGGITFINCTLDTNLNAIGWYCGNASNTTQAAKGKAANAWGLYDLAGNVWEWNWDWFGTYPGTVSDPLGAVSGSYRVFRGGTWKHNALNARAAYRYSDIPDRRYDYLGFRLARSRP